MNIKTVSRSVKALALAGLLSCGAMAGAASAAPTAVLNTAALGPTSHGCITSRVCDYWFGIPVHCRVDTVCISPTPL